MIGEYAKTDEDMPDGVSWRLHPKDKRRTLNMNDVLRELWEYGMQGCVYVQIIQVPEDFPWKEDDVDYIDLYEPIDALKALADYERVDVVNSNGERLVYGRNGMPEWVKEEEE